jgi:predicted RNase H-like HicB family nuclease
MRMTTIQAGEWRLTAGLYRCPITLVREDDGTFSAVAASLPGAGSCGDTVAEALANAKEALEAVIESYLAAGQPIPWRDETPAVVGESWRCWVFPQVTTTRE